MPFLDILAFHPHWDAKTECFLKTWIHLKMPFCRVDCEKGGFQKQWGIFKRDSYCTNRYNGICLIIEGLVRDKSFKVHWSEALFILYSIEWLSVTWMHQRVVRYFASKMIVPEEQRENFDLSVSSQWAFMTFYSCTVRWLKHFLTFQCGPKTSGKR